MTSAAARSAALKKALVEAVAEIADEPTRLHITAKYTDAEMVAESASDSMLSTGTGDASQTIQVAAKTLFARHVLDKMGQSPEEEGGPTFAALQILYRRCAAATTTVGNTGALVHTGAIEVYRADLATDHLEEFFNLGEKYRDARVAALEAQMHRKLFPQDLPSDRMWGIAEKRIRERGFWKKVLFKKVQNAQEAKPLEDSRGVTKHGRWTLPPLDSPFPQNEHGLEEACHIIERLMFLSQFIQTWDSVHTFHTRFWRRVHRAKRGGPGYRQLTVTEIAYAYDQYQNYWEHVGKKIHSGTVDAANGDPADFDECVRECLPEDDFNLIRMAMNLDARPSGGPGAGGRGAKRERSDTPPRRSDKGGKGGKSKGMKGEHRPAKATPDGQDEHWKNKHAKVVEELKKAQVKLGALKWQGGGGGGGKGGGGTAAPAAAATKAEARPQGLDGGAKKGACRWHKQQAGSCKWGDACKFTHE